jgi:hypothetical protein
MTPKAISVLAIVAGPLFVGGCSVTPGDAALRADEPEAAARLYKSGADMGDGLAALKLGALLHDERVSSAIYGQSVDWYRRACELGLNEGCHNVGVDYEYAQGGATQDYHLAHDFYLKAAERGYARAQYNLGSLYSNRYLPNAVEGYTWMLIAIESARRCEGEEKEVCQWILKDPPGHTNRLRQMLSAAEITEAETRANQWRPKLGS